MGQEPDKAEITVTPEIIRAGMDVYAELNPELENLSFIVRRIYEAMCQAKEATIASTASLKL